MTILAASIVLISTLAVVYIIVNRLRRVLDQLRHELEVAATTDALTGLYNRRQVMERFAQEVNKAIRTGTSLACAILDADDFKALNDRYGHPVGDVALKTIASAMKETLRKYDTPSRYGGEEFLIVFPDLDGKGAMLVCDRLRQAIADATRSTLPEGRAMTVSIGIGDLASVCTELAPADSQRDTQAIDQATDRRLDLPSVLATMIRHADSALYEAKASGKDRCVVYPGHG